MFKEDSSLTYLQNDASTPNPEMYLILIPFLILAQLSVLLILHPQIAHAAPSNSISPQISYNCFDPHCYGVNDWFGGTNGVFSAISVVHLSGADYLVDDEEWLFTSNRMCAIDNQGDTAFCDVEAGYIYRNGGNEAWFWVDIRPNGGLYHEHDSPALASGDYGNVADMTINPNGTPGQWSVQIVGHSSSYGGTSTNDSIAPNAIQIGQELYGFGGANAPKALFQDNEWLSSSSGWYYQYVDGTIDYYRNPNNPPWAGWDQGHDPAHYPYGGVLYTCTLPSNGRNPC